MCLTAETVTVDEDEGRFTLEIVDDEGDRHSFIIQHIDLNAFYDQVKGRIGPYLQEKEQARQGMQARPWVCRDEEHRFNRDDVYDRSSPKHPAFHSTHADIWDARAGK